MIKRIIFILSALIAAPSWGQVSGDLDSTFHAVGFTITDPTPDIYDYGMALAIQADGKIVVVGKSNTTPAESIIVIRYQPDGSLDGTFGNGGIVHSSVLGLQDVGLNVAVQPDGKILVAGFANDGVTGRLLALLRYNADGTLDPGFSGDGMRTDDLVPGSDTPTGLALQSDGRILVVLDAAAFTTVRYTADGELDPSFGSGGIVTTEVGSGVSISNAVVVQPDGYIIVAGLAYGQGTYQDLAAVRYAPDGTLDTDFGTNGYLLHALTTGPDNCLAAWLRSDGKLILVGYHYLNMGSMIVTQFDANGVIDPGFGNNGSAVPPTDAPYEARSVDLLPDGRIVVCGGNYLTGMALAVFNPDGTPDMGFGQDGLIRPQMPDIVPFAQQLAVQTDGRIVTVGTTSDTIASTVDVLVARFHSETPSGLSEIPMNDPALVIAPNPAGGAASAHFTLDRGGRVTLRLFDARGRLVRDYLSGAVQAAGTHTLPLDPGEQLASGTYALRFENDGRNAVKQWVKP